MLGERQPDDDLEGEAVTAAHDRPKQNGAAAFVNAAPTVGILNPHGEGSSVAPSRVKRGASNTMKHARIDPVLKAWIDNVIVPALVDQWAARQTSAVGVNA